MFSSPHSKPTLGQIDNLIKYITKDEALTKHFSFDYDTALQILKTKTLKQIRYANALIINSKRFELNKLLLSFGFMPKKDAEEIADKIQESDEDNYKSSHY